MFRTISTSMAMGLMLAVGMVSGGQMCKAAPDMEGRATQPENTAVTPKAQKRSHKWWRGDDARTDFGITAQQSRDLEAIFQQTLPMLKAKKADVDREEKVLAELLAAASTTRESAMIQAVERVEARRRSLSRTFTMMQYRMYRLLTSEQRLKVLAYQDQNSQFQGSGIVSTRR